MEVRRKENERLYKERLKTPVIKLKILLGAHKKKEAKF
jgi:hypothetical protein